MITDRIIVSFACNDPDNGNPTGSFEFVEFSESFTGDRECELHGPETTVRIDESEELALVQGVPYRVHGIWYHQGNWCWDAVSLSLPAARNLLKQLLQRGFQAEEWTTDGPLSDLVKREEVANG